MYTVVPNIASLCTLDKTVYNSAKTLGYYLPGDNGSADYYLDVTDTSSSSDGGSIIVANDGGRWKFVTPFAGNIRQFGAKGDGITDDTLAIKNAAAWSSAPGGYQTAVGTNTGGYVSQAINLSASKGVYKLTDEIMPGSYFKLTGDNAFFIQWDINKEILSGINEAYQWDIKGINFVGGNSQVRLQNNNIDTTRWNIENCTFSLCSEFSIKTFPTGGATSHLSANLTVKNCAFYKPHQILLNYCDSAVFDDCWAFISKDNFSSSTPVFVNGSLATDGHPNIYLNNMFGVPDMGTQGIDRLANVRWADVFKGSFFARNSRFGGESAGMPVVYWFAPPVTTYPFRGNTVSIVDCECFAGPASANDSAIVSLQGQIPQRISIVNCAGPLEVPYVIDAGGQIGNIDAYFANYAASSGQPSYSQFRFNFMANDSLNPDGSIYTARIPLSMRIYSQNLRATKVTRSASQPLSTGNNIIKFDTLNYDSQGGWSSTNSNRLALPMGASKMLITCDVVMTGSFNGGVLDLQIQNSSSIAVSRQSYFLPANPDGPAMSISYVADGNPGEWFQINIRSTATNVGSIISAVATTQSLDYIG